MKLNIKNFIGLTKSILVLTLALVISGCATTGGNSFKIKEHKEITLSNGLKVYLIPDQSLPYTSYELLVKVGSVNDPQGQEGISSFVGTMLKKGTRNMSALGIADELGQVGSHLSIYTANDYTMISSSGLSFHQDKVLDVFSQIITEPSFNSMEIVRLRKQYNASFQKTVDNPSHLASIAFNEYLYQDHPYGRRSQGTPSSLKEIKKKHIIKFYRKYFRPNNSMLSVVGNYPKNIKQILEDKFGNWKVRKSKTIEFPVKSPINGYQVQLVHKPGLKQSEVRIGHYGIKRTDKDFLSIRLANMILGGGFTSRLMADIRVKRGLTYGVSSQFSSKLDGGSFLINTSTRHEKVGEIVSRSLSVLDEFVKKGVTEEEVNSSKALLKGSFPRAIETAEKLASNLLILKFYGIGEDYLNDYMKNIDKLTTAEVNRVIKQRFKSKDLKILVLSPKASKAQLKALGDINMKSYKDFL
ncbi:MAG: insulinase family protein [Bdellovibrionaceae bacterium]|jgi:zinc protease|nr:insulinase family protein [Pseudobdellovibrionaceae bacterium]